MKNGKPIFNIDRDGFWGSRGTSAIRVFGRDVEEVVISVPRDTVYVAKLGFNAWINQNIGRKWIQRKNR